MGTPQEENKSAVPGEPTPSTYEGEPDFLRSNLGDIIAYIFLTLGLLYSFFEPFWGAVPVGVILGIYFSAHIFQLIVQFREFLIQEGIFRGFAIIAGIAALVILAPGLCLGLAGGTLVKAFFRSTD